MSDSARHLFKGFNGDWMSFKAAVGLGQVPGYANFRKFGMNNDVPGTGSEEMWPIGTSRVLPSVAATASVVSSSTADDAATGNGAWVLRIEGLSAGYAEIAENITLDGQVAVASTQEFLRVHRAYIISCDPTGAQVNTGNITISVGGDTQSYIEAGEGQSHQTHYTVPAGKTLLVDMYTVGVGRMAGSSDCQIAGEINAFGTNSWRVISDVWVFNGEIHRNDSSITTLPQKTEIRQRITSSSATQAFGIVGGVLVDNNNIDERLVQYPIAI